jgi:hypothetical protein
VPRIRLRVEERPQLHPCLIATPAGDMLVPHLRLFAQVRFRPPGRPPLEIDALVDTGSPLTLLDPSLWRFLNLCGLLTPVPFAGGVAALPLTAAASSGTYTLARLSGAVFGPAPNGSEAGLPISILAQLFSHSNVHTRTYPFIIGLHAGALDGLRLCREPLPTAPGAAPAPVPEDYGEWFAQEWFLETP